MTASPPSSSLTVGVLGGMGPDATVDFMAKVLAATPASADQEHVHMLTDHNPHVPDRTRAILARDGEPGPVLAQMAKQLQDGGADIIVMPCNRMPTNSAPIAVPKAFGRAAPSTAPPMTAAATLPTPRLLPHALSPRPSRAANRIPPTDAVKPEII